MRATRARSRESCLPRSVEGAGTGPQTCPSRLHRCGGRSKTFASWLADLAACVPDRALRVRGLGVGEDAQDVKLTADLALVEALEAPPHHLGRGAVAEATRSPEPELRLGAFAERIERAQSERAGLDVVGGEELDLAVEIAPVRRELGDGLVPRACERLRDRGGGLLRNLRPHELQVAVDPGLVQAAKQVADTIGLDRS